MDKTPGLKLTVDYGQLIIQGFSDNGCKPLLAHARHVHAWDRAKDLLQASMAKENTIDFAGMVRELQRLNYVGYICCECVWSDWRGCNKVDNMSETIMLRDILRDAMVGHGDGGNGGIRVCQP